MCLQVFHSLRYCKGRDLPTVFSLKNLDIKQSHVTVALYFGGITFEFSPCYSLTSLRETKDQACCTLNIFIAKNQVSENADVFSKLSTASAGVIVIVVIIIFVMSDPYLRSTGLKYLSIYIYLYLSPTPTSQRTYLYPLQRQTVDVFTVNHRCLLFIGTKS